MATIWELDFYSRPVLDENNKKIWELLICDTDRQFEWVKECPSNEVNSTWLANQLREAVTASQQTPLKIRFFRPSMSNIITRGCKQAEIPALASRRLFTLSDWLQERMEQVYPQRPGFQAVDPKPLPLQVQAITSLPVPNALMGDRWILVSLTAADLASASEWSMDFGETFQTASLPPDLVIPGIIMISARALPLAAWMSGVDPVFLKFERAAMAGKTQLLLEASADDSWILTSLQAPKDSKAIAEGDSFEAAKQKANGIHFLAVQTSPDVEHFAGFWLLREV
ncbi:Tab2/Atab2 family RNA-binding protein [Tumidithrix elongata RA019]|uniref:Tab2/Atab2 family RNA-binding protein n=1 Tax=Tumidithrix elongata BACA0141 TaxID=2716417 RepID=A0AAW9Q0Y1_9CYAN|nr:Tab2/Atab2 family RNA-binding protein [Tumidithrix elongata RA019]